MLGSERFELETVWTPCRGVDSRFDVVLCRTGPSNGCCSGTVPNNDWSFGNGGEEFLEGEKRRRRVCGHAGVAEEWRGGVSD